jgi:hypothetical protein
MAGSEPTRLHRWTSLNWDHTDFPLFSLYGPIDHKPDAATIEKMLQETRNVLDIHGFREVVLADDEKGISMTLDDQDGRALKKTRDQNRTRMVCRGGATEGIRSRSIISGLDSCGAEHARRARCLLATRSRNDCAEPSIPVPYR